MRFLVLLLREIEEWKRDLQLPKADFQFALRASQHFSLGMAPYGTLLLNFKPA
jgi:hypothetical protein